MKIKQSKSDNELLQEISNKLSELIAISGIANKNKEDQIIYLANQGYSNVDISRLIGIPKGTVDVIRAKSSKNKRK
ncbi:MAG TPA: hypothetical protein VIU12_21180 [Chryseolinea sp.]